MRHCVAEMGVPGDPDPAFAIPFVVAAFVRKVEHRLLQGAHVFNGGFVGFRELRDVQHDLHIDDRRLQARLNQLVAYVCARQSVDGAFVIGDGYFVFAIL